MKYLLILILFFTTFGFAISQTELSDTSSTKQVEILNADKLQFQTNEDGSSVRKLVGNVALKQEETFMYCDSAYLFKEDNILKAFGNVHIEEKDSVDVYSNSLDYNGNTKKAKLMGDAKLTDGALELVSDTIHYDVNAKVGSYKQFGTLTTEESVLTSKKGSYYSQSKMAHFNDSVVIVDPNYRLTSDTLQFNTSTKVAYFYGPTTIYNDSSLIKCFSGTYDTENEIATFGEETIIENGPQILISDSLYYERFRGYGKAYKYFKWSDSEMEAGMTGTDAEYFEEEEKIIAYNRPILDVKMDDDTLYLSGDVVQTQNNDELGEKEFLAYPNVRMYQPDLQGVCDSMYFSFSDSLFRMYSTPILWSDNSEMKGDTIFAQIKSEAIDQIDFRQNAFVVTQSIGKVFDQIKAKNITGYFIEDQLQKLIAIRNAESLYFGKNESDEFVGSNKVLSSKINIRLKDNEISKITFLENPDAIFTPMQKLDEVNYYLDGFEWNGILRPKSPLDL